MENKPTTYTYLLLNAGYSMIGMRCKKGRILFGERV